MAMEADHAYGGVFWVTERQGADLPAIRELLRSRTTEGSVEPQAAAPAPAPPRYPLPVDVVDNPLLRAADMMVVVPVPTAAAGFLCF